LLSESTLEILIHEIENLSPRAPSARTGLAQLLAEQGLLPMYGMPTRVRDLYLGIERGGSGKSGKFEWSSMDRDLEMAIFEFAPGNLASSCLRADVSRRALRCLHFVWVGGVSVRMGLARGATMGHIRLGTLPKTKKWDQVVGCLASRLRSRTLSSGTSNRMWSVRSSIVAART
jgi:hypothetical protein